MNKSTRNFRSTASYAAGLVLVACASTPSTPEGAVIARNSLTELQSNSELASRARIEIQDAERAVILAEVPERDQLLSSHRILLANRKVEIATLWAESRLYEDQREALSQASDDALLEARARETDVARRQAQTAQSSASLARINEAAARSAADAAQRDASVARDSADTAANNAADSRRAANIARDDAADARADAASARVEAVAARRDAVAMQMEKEYLEQQIVELNARSIDRGLLVTLGDVLFASGNATIIGSNDDNLGKLAGFLKHYEDRQVTIEGHTDSVGSLTDNMNLSLRRANAVKDYLIAQGIDASRLSAAGKGEDHPVSSNDTDTGRQQNRRVEVIIANAPEIGLQQ